MFVKEEETSRIHTWIPVSHDTHMGGTKENTLVLLLCCGITDSPSAAVKKWGVGHEMYNVDEKYLLLGINW